MKALASGGLSPSFRTVVVIGVVALLLLLAVGGLRGRRELAAAERREAALETRLRETRASIGELELRIERLRNDPAALERLARDELMMTRPDEIVIVFPRPPAPQPADTAGAVGEPTPAAGPAAD